MASISNLGGYAADCAPQENTIFTMLANKAIQKVHISQEQILATAWAFL